MDELADLRHQYRELLERLERNEREFRRLGRAVWRVQEDERRRLARELHDGIGQNLTVLKHRLGQLDQALPPGDGDARNTLAAALALCGDTLQDTRELSRLLRPPILDDLGLEAALRWLVRSQAETSGAAIDLDIAPLPALDGEVQTLLFRVAQEALNNAAKHAQARHVHVQLAMREGGVQLLVQDDGRGCDPDQVLHSGGSGLGGMRERLRLYGGLLQLRSVPGEGLRLSARVPLAPA
ncbi:sensor histidine kinase [Lysobacter silvisoli]|uniref:histidine kinase n=1 Tax=Lysobacter silvisoli TaxID=2293254 RepID=A0A371K5H1_9GAMM|nr:sensor histidine kinase [Lysobacter silvisoli]RDZ29118.1 sensor histidine kinase [Lysobacter silvisoli]